MNETFTSFHLAAMALVCSRCARPMPTGRANGRYLGQWMCSRECEHAAGDRSGCLRWNCGCTDYAKKRRLLREHRVNMRVMDDVILENGLDGRARSAGVPQRSPGPGARPHGAGRCEASAVLARSFAVAFATVTAADLRAKRIQKCSRGMLEVLRSVGATGNGTSCWDLLNESFAQL